MRVKLQQTAATPTRVVAAPRLELRLVYWMFGLGLLAPVWMGSHFPTEDGFAHLSWVEVYRTLGDPRSPLHQFFERNLHWNTANASYFALQYGLATWLDPHLAQQLVVSLIILASVASAYVLSMTVAEEVTVGALASLVLIHSSWLYGGYLSFLVGVPLLVVSLAVLLRIVGPGDKPPSAAQYVILSLLGVGGYYSHLIVGGIFVVLLGGAALFYGRRLGARALPLVVAALPVCVLILSYLFGQSLGTGRIRWEPLWKTMATFFGLAFFRGFANGSVLFWLALALLAAVMAVLLWGTVRAFRRGELPRDRRFVLVLAAVLAVFYFLSPDGAGQGYNLKARYQFVMWALLLPTLPYGMSHRARAAVAWAISLLLVWQIADFSGRVRRFNRAYIKVLEQAEVIPAGATVSSVLPYSQAGFEHSFIRVLASFPEELCYHRRCVVLGAHHSGTPFYWVWAGRSAKLTPDYLLNLTRDPRGRPGLEVGKRPRGRPSGHRSGRHSRVVKPANRVARSSYRPLTQWRTGAAS